MSFLPKSSKPRRSTYRQPKVKKFSLIERVALRVGFAVIATIACVATLQYAATQFLTTISTQAQPKTQPDQSVAPAALVAAENYLKAQGCTPLTGARLESQSLPPGIIRDPSASMAISLFGMCPKTLGEAVIAYQDNRGNVALSDPIFVTVSLLKLSIDGSMTATGTLHGQKTPGPIRFRVVGSKLVPSP